MRARVRGDDEGAAAVEFALVSVLLFTLLFGIIQYGYGFYQLQALSSAVHDSARLAQVGIADCSDFVDSVKQYAEGKGLDSTLLTSLKVTYQDDAGTQLTAPERGEPLTLQLTLTPFKLGMPFIPFPDSLSQQTQVRVEDIGVYTSTITWPGVCP